jgi:hypothetical protein
MTREPGDMVSIDGESAEIDSTFEDQREYVQRKRNMAYSIAVTKVTKEHKTAMELANNIVGDFSKSSGCVDGEFTKWLCW